MRCGLERLFVVFEKLHPLVALAADLAASARAIFSCGVT